MLNNSKYLSRFIGGDVFQSFLSGADYHRWHAPIAGTVVETQLVDGLMFSELHSQGFDDSAGTMSQIYEANVNTRALIFIESEDPTIGLVCVVPIGITEISSVTIDVKVGDRVNKGQELGCFSYGGSSMCLVFQKGAINSFTIADCNVVANGEDSEPRIEAKIKVNAQVAVAS